MTFTKRFIQAFHVFLWAGLFLLVTGPSFCVESSPTPSPESPGTFFIHEKIRDLAAFQTAFQGSKGDFKANGFTSYSLHQDINGPSNLILILQCSNLEKGKVYLSSKPYESAMKKAGVSKAVLWYGADVLPRPAGKLPPKPAGIVVARNDLKSYDYWKSFYDSEHDPSHGGKNPDKQAGYHAERHYEGSHYSIHRGLEKHDVAYVVHEASDVTKAPEFMTSQPMRAMKKPLGILKFQVWYGYNLEQGTF
jgi:hypothetical protein